jgi:hypothetical protein
MDLTRLREVAIAGIIGTLLALWAVGLRVG